MRPVWIYALVLSTLGAGIAATPLSARAPARAQADLKDASGKSVGRADVRQSTDGLWVTVRASGLTPGAHGIHVHAIGTCTAPDFTSAGPHWNPDGHQHGRKNPNGAHAGDAPNIVANAKGRGSLKVWLGAGLLTGGPQALLDTDGAAVVIHADPDDEMTDPSGKSGKRIVCGVLTAR
ncbi:MAG: hypothetical protein RIT52_734 [Pseudomonadota bacterium]|jgi:Cu-Zn family superoxide dismutase